MPHLPKRPTFAEDDVLLRYGCKKKAITQFTNNDDKESFYDRLEHGSGWTFSCHHHHILSESDRILLAKETFKILSENHASLRQEGEGVTEDCLHLNGFKIHYPPMLFANDEMNISFGAAIVSVSAGDAICCWANKHTAEEISRNGPLEVIKVPYAKNWGQSRSLDGSNEDTLQIEHQELSNKTKAYDWTYSSDYCCSVAIVPSLLSVECKDSSVHTTDSECNSDQGKFLIGSTQKINGQYLNNTRSSKCKIVRAPTITDREVMQSSRNIARWRLSQISVSGIDYELLKRRDEPILFYDEFILYQDDLEDCGEILYDAKLRVMPSCWFLLIKQYLRVDGVIARSRETRLFHKFEIVNAADSASNIDYDDLRSTHVYMDVCWREYMPDRTGDPTKLTTQDTSMLVSINQANASATLRKDVNVNVASVNIPSSSPPQLKQSMFQRHPGVDSKVDDCYPLLFSSTTGKNSTHILPQVNERVNIGEHFILRYES